MGGEKNEKLCPLMCGAGWYRYCEGKKCGWWDNDQSQCGIVTIGQKL